MKNRIGELRREKGLTLKQMGKLLDVKDNTLSQYETGKRDPQVDFLIKTAEFFGVSLEYLIGESDVRDYIISDKKSGIELLEKIKTGELSYDNISIKTLISLAAWAKKDAHILKKQYPDLYTQAKLLFEYVTNENSEISTIANAYSLLKSPNKNWTAIDPKTGNAYNKQSLIEEALMYNKQILEHYKSLNKRITIHGETIQEIISITEKTITALEEL
ncbi:helix-turn-helix domain-containing protein [Vagococcus lutrae]|uniref:helix-turn-helix domain-containing protein n=1 Tax=Vagococcus lutrae TaxID=81947 RepID=UPI0020983475|nr:helix-turn-helix transcriptional regulator [Vagococcus lutrae]MCO7150473.1 helix-turn-helix transcriptional regulator [Vagococcus lutrae]